nr:MAG TPA: hypothetical protein [Caudoviricetes sp.]
MLMHSLNSIRQQFLLKETNLINLIQIFLFAQS